MPVPADINLMQPQSGQTLRDDNSRINRADYEVARRSASLEQQSRDGTLFRSFFQGVLPAATTYYFILDIPVGTVLYGIARNLTIEAGSMRAAFFNGGAFTDVDAVYPAFNFDNRDTALAPQCQLKRVSGVSGLQQQTPNTLITAPTTGPIRQPSTQTAVGAQVVHNSNNLPFFSLQNDTGADEPVTLYLFWQELPA